MFRAGDQIGPYTLINKLGKGAFGVVWLAERRTQITTTTAAIKIPLDEEISIETIKQEADLWVRASGHPNVLPIVEANIYDEHIVIASEYAPDGSLEAYLKNNGGRAPSVEAAVEIAAGILAGLEHLHSRDIIHRDLKPANVLFQGNTPRLADFGISRILKSTNQSSVVAGTPSYMAPEAFDGKRNEQTDIWSVGVMLYQLLTGSLPFSQEYMTEIMFAVLTKDFEPLPDEIPAGLVKIVEKALAKKPEERFLSAQEMREDLKKVLTYLHYPQFSPTEEIKKPITQDAVKTVEIDSKFEAENKTADDKVHANHLPVTKPSYPQDSIVTQIKENFPTQPTILKPSSTPKTAAPQYYLDSDNEKKKKGNFSFLFIGGGILFFLVLFFGVYSWNNSGDVKSGQATDNSTVSNNNGTVKVGVYADLTGGTSSFGKSTKNGIELAVDEINKAGGVNGKKIELIVEDDQGRPEQAKTVVSKLINQDKVQAILGEVASSNTLAAAPIAQEAKVPMISPAATNPKVTEAGDYISRICFIDPVQGTMMAKFAVNALNAKTAAILGDSGSDYNRGLTQFFEEEFTRLGGQMVAKQNYTQSDSDFRAQLTTFRNLKPDVIYLPGYYGQVALIAKQARNIGLNVPLLGGDGWDSPQIWIIGGEALENTYISNHYAIDNPAPEVQNFVKAYRAKFNNAPDSLAALAYDAARVLADAIRRAGGTESVKLRDAINSTKDFQGVTGKISIDRNRNGLKPGVILKLDPETSSFVYKETIYP